MTIVQQRTQLYNVLTALMTNPHLDLGDLIYTVREREGEGWDGPAVKAWAKAVSDAKRLLFQLSQLPQEPA